MSHTPEIADHHQVSTRIVEAVAEREGIDPTELTPPLYESIDPGALESLFAPTARGERGGTVEFSYRGYRITVSAGTELTISVDPASSASRRRSPEVALDD